MDGEYGIETSSNGAVYFYERVNNNWILFNKLTSSDAFANDNFGLSLSIFHEWVSVGSIDDDNGINSGSAYIFQREDNSFIQKAKILNKRQTLLTLKFIYLL